MLMKYFVSKTKGHKKKVRDKMSHRLIFYETFQYGCPRTATFSNTAMKI